MATFVRAAEQARVTRETRRVETRELVAEITGELQCQQASQPSVLPPLATRTFASLVTDFCRIQPPTFTGEGDPDLAEKWEEQILKYLDVLEVQDDATRIRLTTFQFRDSAETWWKSVRNSRDVLQLTWVEFSRLFLERFLPVAVQEQRRVDFINLKQQNLSVAEYAVRFTTLSRFAPEMVSSETQKCRRFEQGLDSAIGQLVIGHVFQDYGQLVNGAFRAERQIADTKRIHALRRARIAEEKQLRQQSRPSRQYKKKKRTRDDVGSSGSVQRPRTPQFDVTVPVRDSGYRRNVICQGCGKRGHLVEFCRFVKAALRATSDSVICHHCRQPGHVRRKCPQWRKQKRSENDSLQQT